MQADNQMQEKQIFLRKQILDKRYDVELFIKFLDKRLNIGDDLSMCSLDQLKQVVQEFKVAQNRISEVSAEYQESTYQYLQLGAPTVSEEIEKQQKQTNIIQKQQTPTTTKLSTAHTRYIQFNKYNFTQPQFIKTFPSVKIHQKFDGKMLHCEVSNPQRKTIGGIFGIGATSFLQFQVKTHQMSWTVGRRYSDFIWLRQYLRRINPTQIVPPIPEKKAHKRTQRQVQKRMRILQYFLNDIVNIPQFRNNRVVNGFLKIEDARQFAQLKQDGDKAVLCQQIKNVQTISGQVTVSFKEQTRAYLQQMKKFIPQVQPTYKQITRNAKAIQNMQTEQINKLYDSGNLFASLHQKSRQILNRIPKANGLRKLNDMFITMNNMSIQWGNILSLQFPIIQKNFNSFFKYIRNDLHGYAQLFLRQEQLEEEFCKMRTSLDKKKQKIFNLFDMSKWELSKEDRQKLPQDAVNDKVAAFKVMLPKDNKELDRLRMANCLYISQIYANGNQNFLRSANKFQENFKEWAIKIKVNYQQMTQLWSQMSVAFSGEGKTAKQLKEKPVDQYKGDNIIGD